DVPRGSGLLDLNVADGQPLALPAGEQGVGLEHLEPLAEGGAERDAADVRSAALSADDLPVALQALQRQSERSPRDAHCLGELRLGGQAVARAGAVRRESLAKCRLGFVDQRASRHFASVTGPKASGSFFGECTFWFKASLWCFPTRSQVSPSEGGEQWQRSRPGPLARSRECSTLHRSNRRRRRSRRPARRLAAPIGSPGAPSTLGGAGAGASSC